MAPAVALVVAVVLIGAGVLANVLVGRRSAPAAPTASASVAETASAPSASASVVEAPIPSASASASEPPAPVPTTPFNKRVALAALAKVGKDLSVCRRHNGLWGIGGATVYFANDGTISKLTMGPPFRAAPEGTCVTEQLMTAKIEPFAGPAPAVVYTFVVPLYPTLAKKK